jgi:DNA-binding transcriptional ArsR family regulator
MDVLDVLAEPQRRRILDALRDGERPVGELASELHLAQPSVSKHLKTLRDAGLVAVRPDAQRRLYRLRVEPLRELDDWLEPYRRMWTDSLDALEQHLDAMPDDQPDVTGTQEDR